MSTLHGITELGPATAKRQVYSPFEQYWNAFLEWRKRNRLHTQLCHLTDASLPTSVSRAVISITLRRTEI